MLAPPRPPAHDELEALIREARERQRRRRVLWAAVVAVGLGAGLAAWAAIVGGGPVRHAAAGGANGNGSGSRGTEAGRRAPILEVGSSGGVTWAFNGLAMWLTTNGGRTWRASAPRHVRGADLPERVEQVSFVDPRHGWVFAVDVHGGLQPAWRRHAELDSTSDGGHTWRWTIPRSCCGSVSFLTPRQGFFVADSQLLATTDGGATWKRVSRVPFAGGVPAFVDADHGIVVVPKAGLYRTADAGRHWAAVHLPGGPLPRIAVFGRRLVVPAEPEVRGEWRLVVYVSGDAGATWRERPAPRWWVPLIGANDEQLFSAASPSVWFAAGWRKLAVTTDAGRSWQPIRVQLRPHWTIAGISFTSRSTGWAIFQQSGFSPERQSFLMHTTDGGRHWTSAGPRLRRRHDG